MLPRHNDVGRAGADLAHGLIHWSCFCPAAIAMCDGGGGTRGQIWQGRAVAALAGMPHADQRLTRRQRPFPPPHASVASRGRREGMHPQECRGVRTSSPLARTWLPTGLPCLH